MDLKIANKVAIITGASAGIGEAVAYELAKEGVRLMLVSRSKEKLEAIAEVITKEYATDVEYSVIDMTDHDAGELLAKRTIDRFGRIDIVVNNAGRAHAGGLLDNSDSDWQSMEELKLHAMIRLNRACIPHMKRRGWGRIVNMSSVGGIYPNPKLLVSHVLSAAINNLTKGMALEVADTGILVNAVAVGAIRTENWEFNMLPKIRLDHPEFSSLSNEELVEKVGSEYTPVGRFGTPEEVAAITTFLCSAKNSFTTGCTIEASGGAERFF